MAPDIASLRRSFVEGRLAGLKFGADIGALALADFSLRPRIGIKGAGALAWLKGQKIPVAAANNRAKKSAGKLVARLSPNEALVLGETDEHAISRIERELPPAGKSKAYPLPRAETHAWFRVAGKEAPAMLAKLCAVDLRTKSFANLAIAQTLAAQISVVIIRDDLPQTPAFHLLADSASALYLWDCLSEAMAEFGGVVLGAEDLVAAPK
ncbi:MAG: hypothetical protein ACTSUD_11410 [Alphaproteobacteria bacterium]